MPGFGRRYDAGFDDGLPKPPVVVPQVHTQIPVSIPTGAGVANIHNSLKTENKMNAVPPGGTAHVPHSSVPTGVSHPVGPAIGFSLTPLVPVPQVFVPVAPHGVSIGNDLLDKLTCDEVASLFSQRLLFEDEGRARKKTISSVAECCGCDIVELEQWLSLGPAKEKNTSANNSTKKSSSVREEGDVAAGLRKWLAHDAADAALSARDSRAESVVPVAPATTPDPYVRRHPYPPPKVCAVIKSDAYGVVYVAGEKPGAPGSTPPPIGTEGFSGTAPLVVPGVLAGGASGLGNAAAATAAGEVVCTASRVIARAGSTRNSSPSVSGLQQSPLSGSLRGDEVVSTASGGHGLSGLNPGIVKTELGVNEDTNEPISEEEKARREQSCRAFGNKGDLLHVFGSTRIDESEIPLHTQMLFDKHFWLAKAVGALPSATPQTPWVSPSPASRARDTAAAAAADADAKGKGRKNGGDGGPGGRCAVSVPHRPFFCTTHTAPAKCLRRGGGGRADALEDPFDEADEAHVAPVNVKSKGKNAGAKNASGTQEKTQAVIHSPPRNLRNPPTPLPAASTAAIASMRKAERKERRRLIAEAKRKLREEGIAVSSDESDSPSSSESSESEDEPESASNELAELISALDSEPMLRAAAPLDEVEGETLALHYELMWQQQANRHVIMSLLGRVLNQADTEGTQFAATEGTLAEANAYMSKVREVRRILKREKRDADQRLALERAAAAAAASSRVGAQRRDTDGNIIAPAHGMDGLPEDVAAAAAAAAAANAGFGRALGVGPGGSPKTAAVAAAAAAAHAARYGMYRGRSPGGRPRIPKHVQDRFAGGVRIGSANALKFGPVPKPGASVPGTVPGHTARVASPLSAGMPMSNQSAGPVVGFFSGVSVGVGVPDVSITSMRAPPAASSSRFGPPEVLVDTIHAAAAHALDKNRTAEKEKQSKNKKESPDLLECAVCAGTAETSKCTETLRCARCALPTHPRCYGVKSVAAGVAACAERNEKTKEANKKIDAKNAKEWLCWVCRDATDRGKANTPAVAAAAATTPPETHRPSLEEKLAMFRGVSCVLCPVQLGAFKQCQDGRWCHVVCAQWMPEITVEDSDVVRAVRGVQQIPKERARHNCVACGRAGGVSMRCSFGHCQVSFHPLCARRAGYHVRASDGNKTNHRAYCDKHSPTMAERDRQKGIGGPAIPPSLEGTRGTGGASLTSYQPPFPGFDVSGNISGSVGMLPGTRVFPGSVPAGSSHASELRPAALAVETTQSLETTASALRKARAELIKAHAMCRAVLRRETVKRGVTRAAVAMARAKVTGVESVDLDETMGVPVVGGALPGVAAFVGAPGSAGTLPGISAIPSSSPTGPSGVTPVAPKRARSQATRGKPRSTPPAPIGGHQRGDGADEPGAKRARRSGSGGSVLCGGDTVDVSSELPSGWGR